MADAVRDNLTYKVANDFKLTVRGDLLGPERKVRITFTPDETRTMFVLLRSKRHLNLKQFWVRLYDVLLRYPEGPTLFAEIFPHGAPSEKQMKRFRRRQDRKQKQLQHMGTEASVGSP